MAFGSGTEALAAALRSLRERSPSARPEVIVPAYGCPDLVSASLYAGLQVRLVDNSPERWGYDEAGFLEALSDDTAAVLSVNLLGVAERSELIRRFVPTDRVVADSAQSLQLPIDTTAGEFVIISFGRGKPLNLLGGGLLVTNAAGKLPVVTTSRAWIKDWMSSSWPAGFLFNQLTRGWLFSLISHVPGSNLGSTRYEQLEAIRTLPNRALSRIGPGLRDYATSPGYCSDVWASVFSRWRTLGLAELVGADGAQGARNRLRLALLAPTREVRNALVRNLSAAGLGASEMYRRPLPEIENVPASIASQGPFPNASALADRLFTLPTHDLVDKNAINRADEIVLATLVTSRSNQS